MTVDSETYLFHHKQFPQAEFNCIECDQRFVVGDQQYKNNDSWDVIVKNTTKFWELL